MASSVSLLFISSRTAQKHFNTWTMVRLTHHSSTETNNKACVKIFIPPYNSLKITIYKIAAFPKKTNRGTFYFISCQVPYVTDWKVKNVSEQQRLRRQNIINNMLMSDKSTAQGLQARPGASLYFAVHKHSLYLKRLTE